MLATPEELAAYNKGLQRAIDICDTDIKSCEEFPNISIGKHFVAAINDVKDKLVAELTPGTETNDQDISKETDTNTSNSA